MAAGSSAIALIAALAVDSAMADTSSSTAASDTVVTTAFVGEIGVKGDLAIHTDKDVYVAGERITGRLRVTVNEPIHCDTLLFTLIGEEVAQWKQTNDHHSRYQEFLNVEILSSVLPDPYLPGEYVFPFGVALPSNAPGVLEAESLVGDIDLLHASIQYTLKACIKVDGRFVSDLESRSSVIVHAKPPARPVVPTSVEYTISKQVRLLGCIRRGVCHLSASMAKDVYTISDSVHVDCFVNNQTSAVAMHQVKCRVYQVVTLHNPAGTDRMCSRALAQVKCRGPGGGEMLERPLVLPMAGKLRHPASRGRFLSCSYKISIECELSWIMPVVRVDFPVIILPDAPVLAAQTTDIVRGVTLLEMAPPEMNRLTHHNISIPRS